MLSGKLAIKTLDIRQVAVDLPAAGNKPRDTPARIVLPLAIAIEQGRLEGLAIRQHGSETPVLIDSIRLVANATAQDIRINELRVNGYQVQLHSTGKLSLAPGFPLDLQLAFSYSLPETATLQGNGSLQGDLHKLRLQQSLSGPLRAKLDAEAMDIAGDFHWQGELNIEKFNPAIFNKALPHIAMPDIRIQGKLNPAGDRHQLSLKGDLQLDDARTGRAPVSYTHLTLPTKRIV